MNVDDLPEIIVSAPTQGAESSALAILISLARDGDFAASRALLRVLAPALGCDTAVAMLAPIGSMEELLTINLPAPLCAYAAALQPRTFLANVKRLVAQSETNHDGTLSALQRLVLSRDVLQHEALKAYILTALARLTASHFDSLTAGQMLPVLDNVLTNVRIVEGRDVDDSMRFGREKLLAVGSKEALYFIITHELGHNLLDLLMSRRRDAHPVTPLEPVLNDLAKALPRLIDAACQLRGRKFEPDDPRSFLGADEVRLLCTHEVRPGGAYFHMSLMQAGGPIDLHLGATYAYFVLSLASIQLSQAAVVWSARGVLHFGFLGDKPDFSVSKTEVVPARILDALTKGPAWVDELQRGGRLSGSERDVPIILGVEPRQPTAYGNSCERAFNDFQHVSQASQIPSTSQLTEPQAIAVLASAWRAAASDVMKRLLLEHPGLQEKLRVANWPLAEIGESLCALRNEDGAVSCYGPTLSGLVKMMHALSDHGVPLNGSADDAGRTLLTRAVYKGLDVVNLVLSCGADPNLASAGGETPLLACATLGSVPVAEALVKAGASLQSRDPKGMTALHRAAAGGHDALLLWLLTHGAEPDARDSNGETALMLVRTRAAVIALCDAGAPLQAATTEGVTALHNAAQSGSLEVVHALLARGADPDAATRQGETPLHYAAFANAGLDCLAALLDAGADIDEETNDGVTPLMLASRGANLPMIEFLLKRGAQVNARTRTGATALIMASDGRNEWSRDFSFNDRIEQCLRSLVKAGADINAATADGITALHAATWGFDASRVKCLLELGANPSTVAHDGTTPLSVAKAKQHAAMVEALTNAASKKATA